MFSIESELKQIVHKIKTHYKPEKIILFGSYPDGKARIGSDIDLLVIKETDIKLLGRELRRLIVLYSTQYLLIYWFILRKK